MCKQHFVKYGVSFITSESKSCDQILPSKQAKCLINFCGWILVLTGTHSAFTPVIPVFHTFLNVLTRRINCSRKMVKILTVSHKKPSPH